MVLKGSSSGAHRVASAARQSFATYSATAATASRLVRARPAPELESQPPPPNVRILLIAILFQSHSLPHTVTPGLYPLDPTRQSFCARHKIILCLVRAPAQTNAGPPPCSKSTDPRLHSQPSQ
ncbi:hypothetical protein BOTBODRAFT_511121 [Botryobasidium botryosum FD-172 SS1]|uniref:Uncharacterized protein n=1 Tax=Botryobasidium botryosum (strain FD-172 SS1) TaxID=930990 RepID=A0A067N3Q8_BOTB1|nr:hypothetical protein BOTBODRAFT_511121 [Botryobasidium botryosum FD-172 SS1]